MRQSTQLTRNFKTRGTCASWLSNLIREALHHPVKQLNSSPSQAHTEVSSFLFDEEGMHITGYLIKEQQPVRVPHGIREISG